jgi:hypothetical protein
MSKLHFGKMDKKWKAWWLAALRGTQYTVDGIQYPVCGSQYTQNHRYKRTSTHLRTELRRFSVLGVLGDGINPTGWELYGSKWRMMGFADPKTLPNIISEQAKLSLTTQHFLCSMNDGIVTFKQAADWIERNL